MEMTIAKMTAERGSHIEQLRFVAGESQWLNAGPFRSCFVTTQIAAPAAWVIEGLLPDGQVIQLADYEIDNSPFNATLRPGYISVNAMCGLPIRFVSSEPQTNSNLWIVFKS